MEREELRQRLQNRPHAVRFSELRALLEAYGWMMARVRGDHHFYVGPNGERLSVPLHRPHLKAVYVREALKLLKD